MAKISRYHKEDSIRDNASLFFLCFGGPSVKESNLLLKKDDFVPVFFREGNYKNHNEQNFKYKGLFRPVSFSDERRTLGLFSCLMRDMRRVNGIPYSLKRVIIMAKENWEWQNTLSTYLNVDFKVNNRSDTFILDFSTFEALILK